MLGQEIDIDLSPDIKISDLIEKYPFLAEYLMEEYGFHCVSCIFSNFDTLKLGAEIHGIIDQDFEEMFIDIKNYILAFTNDKLID